MPTTIPAGRSPWWFRFPPGGTNNIMARIVADKLADALGQQVIVDNRGGGAGGTIGTRQVAHAEPDGYTILLAFTSTLSSGAQHVCRPGLRRAQGFRADRVDLVLAQRAVGASVACRRTSVAELIALLKAGAEPFQFGSPGVGSSTSWRPSSLPRWPA